MKNRIKLFNAIRNDGLFQGKKLIIEITGEFPKDKSFLDAKKLHEEQAELLVNGLFTSLPKETFNAILYEMVTKQTYWLKLVANRIQYGRDNPDISEFLDRNTTKKTQNDR